MWPRTNRVWRRTTQSSSGSRAWPTMAGECATIIIITHHIFLQPRIERRGSQNLEPGGVWCGRRLIVLG